MHKLAFCLAFAVLTFSGASVQADMDGKPEVIDGDTLSIGGAVFDLFGIDAPEPGQTCAKEGQAYDCGFQATNALAFLTAFQWIKCRDQGAGADGVPRMACLLGGRYDLGERLIRQGWALADPEQSVPAYEQAEAAARSEGVGLWAGTFEAPWDWRAGRR